MEGLRPPAAAPPVQLGNQPAVQPGRSATRNPFAASGSQKSRSLTDTHSHPDHPPSPDDQVLSSISPAAACPCVPVAEHRPARLHGYHRDFRLRMTHGRGSPEAPGLMLALTGGGSCRGVALRLPPQNLRAELLLIWRREMLTGVYVPRWVALATPGERVWALAFVANKRSERYIPRPDEATAAEYLRTGRGALGTCAVYLDKTVQDLRAWGLHDRRLERLHRRVFAQAEPGE
nr:gamma-glutamylcyclotransferase [Rhodovibrio salinarum]